MFFIILFVLFSLGFTLLFCFLTNLSLWFLFLWVFLGILLTSFIIVVFCVLFLLIGSKTKPDSSFKHFVLRQGVKTFCILYHVKYSFEGTENIPDSTYVVYANHKSNMDPIFIYLGMNRKVTVIGKSTLVKNFWMKKIFETFGAFWQISGSAFCLRLISFQGLSFPFTVPCLFSTLYSSGSTPFFLSMPAARI